MIKSPKRALLKHDLKEHPKQWNCTEANAVRCVKDVSCVNRDTYKKEGCKTGAMPTNPTSFIRKSEKRAQQQLPAKE